MLSSTSGLRDDVDQRRLALLDDGERALQRRAEILRVGDRPLRVHAHALRDLREVHVRLVDRRADVPARDAALVAVGHPLDVHHLLVIGAVVVHHGQQRDLVMRGGPQHAGRVQQVAVALDVHRQPPVLPVGQRAADRRRRAVADAGAARAAEVLVVLVEVPQPERPAAAVAALGHERPVLVPDLRPELRGQPRGADRRRVPRVRGLGARRVERARVRLLEPRARAPRTPRAGRR